VLQGCVTQSTSTLNIQSLILGQEQDSIGGSFSSSQAFDGLIDEVLIYDKAISAEDITTVYDNQNSGLGYDGSSRDCPISVFPTPVLDHRFDESNWDEANSVNDSSGNEYHANAVNVTPTEGFICRAADLSASGIDDYITLDSASLNNRSNFSISLWYKTAKTGPQSILSGANVSQFNEVIYWFTTNTQFSPWIKGGVQNVTTSDISNNEWHHLVWTRSGNSNLIYRDGVLQSGSATLSSGALNITSLILGQEQDSLGGGFDPLQALEGLVDELLIFDETLTSDEVNSIFTNQSSGLNYDGTNRADCAPALHHFQITHDGNGLTCAVETVTIKACANSDCSTLSTDSVTLDFQVTTSTPTTTTKGSPTFTGSTTLDFNHTIAETLTLSVANATTTATNPIVCDDGTGSSCDMSFAEAGFLISMTAGEACQNHAVAIQAVKKSEVSTSCAPLFVGNQQVDLSFNYISPSVGSTPAIIPTIDTVALENAGAPQTRTLSFNSDATANVTLQYNDAGEIELSASAEVTSGELAGVSLLGSGTATYHPAKLVVTALNSSGILNATDSTDTPVQKAGGDFTIDISAQCGDIANTVTKNYKPQGNDRIEFSAQRTAPAPGVDGTLNINGQEVTLGSDLTGFTDISLAASNFINGVATVNANYSEVGLLQLSAQDKDYDIQVNSQVIPAEAVNVGRFIPDHFTLTTSSVDDITGDLSYMDQPNLMLTYDIEAQNLDGDRTRNYHGEFAKATDNVTLHAENNNDGVDLSVRLSGFAGSWENGVYSDTTTNGMFTRLVDSVDGPYDNLLFAIKVFDPDGPVLEDLDINVVTTTDCEVATDCSAKKLSDTKSLVRFGRWYLGNSYGPETSPITVPMQLQYWNGTSFVINTLDSTTTFNATQMAVNDDDISPGISTASGVGAFVSGIIDPDGILGEISLSAPGAGNQGDVLINYTAPVWLLFDWDNVDDSFDGPYDDNPSATATFGLFRGNDRIIYQREVHN